MSEILEKLVKKYVSGPSETNINLDQIPSLVKDIEFILNNNEIFIGDVYSSGSFNKIYLENSDEEVFCLPGPYSGDVVDIFDFVDALKEMKEAFPDGAAENAAEEILSEMHGYVYFNNVWKEEPHLRCSMISREGKKVELQLVPSDVFDEKPYMFLLDKQGNRYKKIDGENTISLCERDGWVHNSAFGKIDVKALWESLEDVPLNPETEKLEAPWFKFKEGTEKEEIWKWFEQELQVSVHDLMHDMKKVDKMLLSFDKEKFNLKEDRKFSRKKLEGTQSLVR